jgi:hypothetical protein
MARSEREGKISWTGSSASGSMAATMGAGVRVR